MALSDEEQRLLEQMEAALAADDPKLAHAMRGTTARLMHRRRAIVSVLGFCLGVVALIAGMETTVLVSIAGFLIMLASAVTGLTAWQRVAADPQSAPRTADGALFDHLEERWRHRNDDGS